MCKNIYKRNLCNDIICLKLDIKNFNIRLDDFNNISFASNRNVVGVAMIEMMSFKYLTCFLVVEDRQVLSLEAS